MKNFEHRQGSVYCSDKKMSILEVSKLIEELSKCCPWLITCLRIMDIAEIGDVHELTDIITKRID